jgi:hypothetical protein
MNKSKCQEIIDAFKEKAHSYQTLQADRDLSIDELHTMKKEYLNFTRGLLNAMSEQERQDIDLDGVKRIFRNSGLGREELSDDELEDLLKSADPGNYSSPVIDVTYPTEQRSGLRAYIMNPLGYAAMAVVGFVAGCTCTPDVDLTGIEHYVSDNNTQLRQLNTNIMKVVQIGDILELQRKYDSALRTIEDRTGDMKNLVGRIDELEMQYQTAQGMIAERDKALNDQQSNYQELNKLRGEYLRKVLGVKQDIESIVDNLEQGVEKLGVRAEELQP